ncbi:MAG: restriction endonuclease subunit S [Desulfosporosinus sp.]
MRVSRIFLKSAPQALLKYGDYCFVGSSEDTEGSGNFTYLNSNLPAFAGSDTIILRAKREINYRFVAYMFDSLSFREQIRPEVYGVKVFHPTQSIIKRVIGIYPSLDEQAAIAAHLDRRTAEIDEVLADLARQAEMLDTYKRELIAGAVTKGLDKTMPMKDSGVEWIGEIPAHWEQHPLFAVAKENTVKNTGMNCDNLLSLSYGRIIQKDIDTNFGLLPASFEGYQIVQPGYSVLRLTDLQNDKRSLRTGYVTETGIITSAYLGLIPSSQIDSKYFNYLLHAFDLLKIYCGLGGGLRQTLKFADMKRLPVLIPQKPEQEQIVAFIDAKATKINCLIVDINAQIEKLKQYRQIVIYEAVTGKIKVSEG